MHIGIIPDGNRRYMKSINKQIHFLYNTIIKNIIDNWYDKDEEDYTKIIKEFSQVNEITIYVLSSDNIRKRTENELNSIYNIIRKYIKLSKNFKSLIKHNIISTDKDLIPIDLQNDLNTIIKDNNDALLTINFLVGYDYKKDICCSKYVGPIDLLIRTGFEKRTSGFLPNQIANSELFFIDKHFPEFTKLDFINILNEYKNERIKRNGS
jgi:undecaprenyl diphosphate synthase